MAKQKFYRLTKILKTDPRYLILLGERSNGKSYAVKEYCIREYLEKGREFIYLRRFQLETKTSAIEEYFADMPIESLTKGKYNTITVYKGRVYLGNLSEDNKVTRGEPIGYAHYLTGAQHFKSRMYPKVYNIIFEEFISKDIYINNEPYELLDYVSTILRRREGRVFLVGNTISRICPYFNDWQLKNIPRMEQGDIDTYDMKTTEIDEETHEPVTVRIAVEYCENSGKGSTMFFGHSAETINGGAWKTEIKPRLEEKFEHYDKVYELELRHMGFYFILNLLIKTNGCFILYVYPNTKHRELDVVISHEYAENIFRRRKLDVKLTPERIMAECIASGRVAYSDNLTGADFEQILENMGGIF